MKTVFFNSSKTLFNNLSSIVNKIIKLKPSRDFIKSMRYDMYDA